MRIAIVGAGPAGIMAGIVAVESGYDVVFFDTKEPLATLLPTGGGRCNLAYAEFDNTELIKNYSRGGKFLLSVFSRFSTGDTLEFFENIGVETYIQDDLRIFPKSNSSKYVREKLLAKLDKTKVMFKNEKVQKITKEHQLFNLYTEKSKYKFDKIVFAGGIKNNYLLLKKLGITLVEPKPALCAICSSDKGLYSLAGVSLKDVKAVLPNKSCLFGDILFAHSSISGPLAYKISSVCAYSEFPYFVKLNFVNKTFEEMDSELIEKLDKNSKKDVINVVSEYLPRSFAQYLLKKIEVNEEIKSNQVSKKNRNKIAQVLTEFEIEIISQKADGEIVTAGGVDLDYVNPKTMESKEIKNLYFCGEVLNIDGFTGGFNLQNCWSTGYIVGLALANLNRN